MATKMAGNSEGVGSATKDGFNSFRVENFLDGISRVARAEQPWAE
jgi:hypothetical protein